jgi:tetratricopeptide (TPR) repeat protein
VPDEYAGKKVRCKKCGSLNVIPQGSAKQLPHMELESDIQVGQDYHSSHSYDYDERNITSSQQEKGGVPKPAIFTLATMVVLFMGFLVYMFVFRDTWEIDNYARMDELYIEGSNLIAIEEFTAGLDKYEELIGFVGDRDLRDQRLKEYHRKAQEEYGIIKPKWDGIYKPLLSKHQEVQNLIQSMKYDESIKTCNSIIEKHAIHKNDSVVRKKLDGFRELKEQAEVRWQQAINNERNELLPKLVSLKEQADGLEKVDKWDTVIVCLQKIIDSKPKIIWTDEVHEIIDYANIQIINARHLPIMVNLFKQTYELSQKNQWDDVSDRLQKIIDSKPDTSTPEIDKVVKNANEQLANARMVLKEQKQLAEKLKRLEEERRHIEANTTIVECPKCYGTGNKNPRDYTAQERAHLSAVSAANIGADSFATFSIPCYLCKGKGKLKKVFNKYYILE